MRATTINIKKLFAFSFSLITVRELFILGFTLLSLCALAQQQYTLTQYTQDDGLPSGTVRGIFKDTTGYIWFISEGSIARFDGYTFKPYRHNPDKPNSLPVDFGWDAAFPKLGDYYFATRQSYFRFVPTTETFNFPFGDSIQIISIDEARGVNDCYWLNTNFAIYRISKNGTESFPLPKQDTTMLRIKVSPGNNCMLYNRNTKNILYFDYTTKKFSTPKILNRNGIEESLTALEIIFTNNNFYLFTKQSLFCYDTASKSFVWLLDLNLLNNFDNNFGEYLAFNDSLVVMRSKSGFINIYNIRTGKEKLVYVNKKIPEGQLNDRFIVQSVPDNNGGIWFGTINMGLIHYNVFTDELEQYIHEPANSNSLPRNFILAILPDENGVVWVSCYGHGIVKMEPATVLFEKSIPEVEKRTNTQIERDAMSENIRGFLEIKGGHWIATLNGLYAYSNETRKFSNISYLCPVSYSTNNLGYKEFTTTYFGSLAEDRSGNKWIGTWFGELVVYNSKLNKAFPFRRPEPMKERESDGVFRNLFCDSKNRMWISTQGAGIAIVDCNSMNIENITETKFEYNFHDEKDSTSLAAGMAFVVFEDADGNIWAGTENGLCKYNEEKKNWKRYVNILGNEKSIHNNNIRSLCLDKKGILWIGTNGGGLNRYNKEQDNFSHFTVENGLADDQIFSLACDNYGMLWMGTNHGICRFNPEDYTCKNFTEKDGIQNFEYNTGAALKLKDGTLLFGGVAGYNIIDPDKIENKSAAPPVVVISSFKVFDKEILLGNNIITLNYKENNLAFEFAALSYFQNQYNQYAYMLEGVDQDWIFCDKRRFVSYPKLEPGTYTFRVKACNSNNVWNENGAWLQITITPPWWKTIWARILFAMIFVGSIIGWFRYRTHALRKKQKELESEISKATTELRGKNQELVTALENLKSTQEQLIQSEKLAAFGTMAKRMAHEIQNPLNFVNNFSEISNELMNDIKNESATDEEKRTAINILTENLGKIYHHGKRASAIIQQLQVHQRAGTTYEFFEEIKYK